VNANAIKQKEEASKQIQALQDEIKKKDTSISSLEKKVKEL
jgi:peptidoglycan hydrolase CwlO-like protein